MPCSVEAPMSSASVPGPREPHRVRQPPGDHTAQGWVSWLHGESRTFEGCPSALPSRTCLSATRDLQPLKGPGSCWNPPHCIFLYCVPEVGWQHARVASMWERTLGSVCGGVTSGSPLLNEDTFILSSTVTLPLQLHDITHGLFKSWISSFFMSWSTVVWIVSSLLWNMQQT